MNSTTSKTRTITSMAMLCALAYLVMLVGRIPVVLFLKYDPKDVVLAIGGLLYGPVAGFFMSAAVAVLELPISGTGVIGCVMNLVSSAAFVCTAAWIYSKKRTQKGAFLALACGALVMTGVMLLWNYFLTPIYMGMPREAIADMLIPYFLPFNLLKGGLNAAITMLLYKPVVGALRAARLAPEERTENASGKTGSIGVSLLSGALLITCVLFVLALKGVI
ncbi:MAG: ECF transporter S component [Clostridia bacterium]|nr:ECF transporter S component [Clostridia bacterium]